MTKTVAANMINESVLGRYRIVRRLARGGMGAVYLGRTEGAAGFARPVVIKRILPSLMDDEEVAQMFVREAQILSNLQHPNIVSVLDFGQQDDGAYLMVLEYVNGYSLGEWLEYVKKKRGAMQADFAIHVVTRVLDALHYAHTFKRNDGQSLQIIHRDVTPSNVLLNEQGGVKLLDFGIARVSGDETALHTDRSRVKGKLPYLPLETFKGEDPSVRSDVYSAGVMLYELLTGQNPFAGRETADIYQRVLNVVPGSVHAVREDAPEEIDAVLARAMHKDATQRYASAAEFAQALRGLRSGPDESVVESLAAQLQTDFGGGMPESLGIETLRARDRAWRQPTAVDGTSAVGPTADVLHFSQDPPSLRPDQVTVRADVAPALLAAAAGRTPPPAPRPARPRPNPRPDPSADGLLIDLDQAHTVRPDASKTTSAVSVKRVGWTVGIAALVGAAAAAVVLVVMRPEPAEEMVVIRQEPQALRAPAAVPSAPAAVPAPEPTAPAAVAVPIVAAPAAEAKAAATADTAKKNAHEAPTPNAKALTRTFGRRQGRIEKCFTQFGASAPAHPELSIHFWVDADGNVTQAEVEPAKVQGAALGRCLLEVARATSFGPMQRAVSFHIPITAEKL